MVRRPPTMQAPQLVARLHRAEAELLQAMANQLGQWERQIRGCRGLPQPPSSELQTPASWLALRQELSNPTANSASLERLERLASRLLLCRQAEQAIRDGESNWRAILQRR